MAPLILNILISINPSKFIYFRFLLPSKISILSSGKFVSVTFLRLSQIEVMKTSNLVNPDKFIFVSISSFRIHNSIILLSSIKQCVLGNAKKAPRECEMRKVLNNLSNLFLQKIPSNLVLTLALENYPIIYL